MVEITFKTDRNHAQTFIQTTALKQFANFVFVTSKSCLFVGLLEHNFLRLCGEVFEGFAF